MKLIQNRKNKKYFFKSEIQKINSIKFELLINLNNILINLNNIFNSIIFIFKFGN